MKTHNARIHGLIVNDNVCYAQVTLVDGVGQTVWLMTWDWLNNTYHKYLTICIIRSIDDEDSCLEHRALTMLMTEIMAMNTANKHRLN